MLKDKTYAQIVCHQIMWPVAVAGDPAAKMAIIKMLLPDGTHLTPSSTLLPCLAPPRPALPVCSLGPCQRSGRSGPQQDCSGIPFFNLQHVIGRKTSKKDVPHRWESGGEREGERKLPENREAQYRVLWYYESTPSARFVAPFVGPAAAAPAAFLAKTKLAAAEKRW